MDSLRLSQKWDQNGLIKEKEQYLSCSLENVNNIVSIMMKKFNEYIQISRERKKWKHYNKNI